MSDIAKVMKMIKDKEVKFVDLRFTDTKGKWQHTAQTVETINEDTFKDGIMFEICYLFYRDAHTSLHCEFIARADANRERQSHSKIHGYEFAERGC